MGGDVSPLRLLQVPHLPARLAVDLDGREGPLLRTSAVAPSPSTRPSPASRWAATQTTSPPERPERTPLTSWEASSHRSRRRHSPLPTRGKGTRNRLRPSGFRTLSSSRLISFHQSDLVISDFSWKSLSDVVCSPQRPNRPHLLLPFVPSHLGFWFRHASGPTRSDGLSFSPASFGVSRVSPIRSPCEAQDLVRVSRSLRTETVTNITCLTNPCTSSGVISTSFVSAFAFYNHYASEGRLVDSSSH